MGTDNPEALGLEQRCVRPGLWVIEGYTVMRVRHGGGSGRHGSIVRWQVKGESGRSAGAEFRTLGEVREWIKDNR